MTSYSNNVTAALAPRRRRSSQIPSASPSASRLLLGKSSRLLRPCLDTPVISNPGAGPRGYARSVRSNFPRGHTVPSRALSLTLRHRRIRSCRGIRLRPRQGLPARAKKVYIFSSAGMDTFEPWERMLTLSRFRLRVC